MNITINHCREIHRISKLATGDCFCCHSDEADPHAATVYLRVNPSDIEEQQVIGKTGYPAVILNGHLAGHVAWFNDDVWLLKLRQNKPFDFSME